MGNLTDKEIIEGNELIAIFMGAKYNKTSGWEFSVFGGPYSHCNNKLKFNLSWDWLIPVIDKITSMDGYIEFKASTSSMVSEGGIYINTKFIENTWKDVVEFIKWYNSQIQS